MVNIMYADQGQKRSPWLTTDFDFVYVTLVVRTISDALARSKRRAPAGEVVDQ